MCDERQPDSSNYRTQSVITSLGNELENDPSSGYLFLSVQSVCLHYMSAGFFRRLRDVGKRTEEKLDKGRA